MVGRHNFYSSTASSWRKARELAIYKSNGFCNRCGVYVSDTSKLIAHHIDHLKEGDYTNPDKALNQDNIEVLCINCHNEEHDRFKNKRQVFIVYGAPLSGKTTFVKENKGIDDIVVDLDALYSALTLGEMYDKPSALRFNVFAIRDLMYDQIRTRYGSWRNAWIIGGFPNSYERDSLARSLNANCILVDATLEECLQRLNNSTDYRGKIKTKYEKFIRDWFATYAPPKNF